MQTSSLKISLNNHPINKPALINSWQKTFGCPAPVACHVNFLQQAIGWQVQAQKHGGFTAAERRQLLGGALIVYASPAVGSRLIRVWQGETHQVSVVEEGYWYADKCWKSLSAIAKAITGTPWSGPVFFGLKK